MTLYNRRVVVFQAKVHLELRSGCNYMDPFPNVVLPLF